MGMSIYEEFIRSAAVLRHIEPDMVIRGVNHEGGVEEPAKLGDFSGPPWYSGKSWWAFQEHYGGPSYPQWGDSEGMGTAFTQLTGWQPGDPNAWRDAARYALNRALKSGWGAWYGFKAEGIIGYMGIDRSFAFDPNAEVWDFETPAHPSARVTFNPYYPAVKQDDEWSCAPTALTWAMRSLGRAPADNWIEQDMLNLGYESTITGLQDHRGKGIVDWLSLMDPQHYGPDGFAARPSLPSTSWECPISWDALVAEINPNPPYPILMGLPEWGLFPTTGHWTGVYGYDASRGAILLANPASTPTYGQTSLTRAQFEQRAVNNASIVRVIHPDLVEPQPPVIVVPPVSPLLTWRDEGTQWLSRMPV